MANGISGVEAKIRPVVVKRTGRTFGVFVGGILTEGGFFARDAAEACARETAAAIKAGR